MGFKGLFALLFLLFWAVPFPMIMYYGGANYNDGSSPAWAFTWLALSVLFCLLLIYSTFRGLVLSRYIAINKLKNLMQNGELKNSKIIKSTPLPSEYPGVNKYELLLELKNFVGTTITEKVNINESDPVLHRFEAGKTLALRIDKSLKNVPYLQVDGAHYNPPNPRGLILGSVFWIIICGIIGWYFSFAYQHENNGTGWRFLVWYHPLILCPLILLCISFFFRSGRLSKNQLMHKYYGYDVQAQVVSVAQTGVYINDQPQVRFNLSFTDCNNQLVNTSITKTLGILDAPMAQQKTLDIFYLSSNHNDVCLAADLNGKPYQQLQ